jgi:hypothetical protein
MGPIDFPETSVNNYQHTLRNNPEEQNLNVYSKNTRSEGVMKEGT